MHGYGWVSGAARESAAARWLPASPLASRYALGADGVGAARPGARPERFRSPPAPVRPRADGKWKIDGRGGPGGKRPLAPPPGSRMARLRHLPVTVLPCL